MNTIRAGRVVLTVVLLATIAAEVAFTWLGWTGQHIFNPLWHPHARYHAVQMSVCISALSVGVLVLLWRPSVPVRLSSLLVVVLQGCWWGAEFVADAVPGTSPDPDLSRPNTFSMLGVPLHGNLFFAVLMIVLTKVGAVLMTRGARSAAPPSRGRGGVSARDDEAACEPGWTPLRQASRVDP